LPPSPEIATPNRAATLVEINEMNNDRISLVRAYKLPGTIRFLDLHTGIFIAAFALVPFLSAYLSLGEGEHLKSDDYVWLIFLIFSVMFLAEPFVTSFDIDHDRITASSIFGKKTVMIDDIEGTRRVYIRSDSEIIFITKSSKPKKVKTILSLDFDEDFFKWAKSFPDLGTNNQKLDKVYFQSK
jgi:hypothetical protein